MLKKGSIKIKTRKSLTLRVHDITELLPDFVARPGNRPSFPSICKLEQLVSGILQILKKKCILYNYRVKSAKKTAKFQFHTALFFVKVSRLAHFNKVDQKSKFCANFDEKSLNFEIFIKIFSQKNFNQTIQQRFSISNGNKNTLPLKILTYFGLYYRNCAKF